MKLRSGLLHGLALAHFKQPHVKNPRRSEFEKRLARAAVRIASNEPVPEIRVNPDHCSSEKKRREMTGKELRKDRIAEKRRERALLAEVR